MAAFLGMPKHMQSTCKCPDKEGPRSTRAAGTAVTLNKLNTGEPKATKEKGKGIAANLARFLGHPISPWSKHQINSVSYGVTTTSVEQMRQTISQTCLIIKTYS